MDSLMDTVSGVYRVVTLASTYVIDLDREVIRREPRPGHPDSTLLRGGELIALLEVVECSVGRRMIVRIDLHVLGFPVTARLTTQFALSIDPVPAPAMETAR